MAKICHVSSAHRSHDIRIFVKECRSLAAAGHEVYFVVHGESEEVDGVRIVGLGDPPASRRERMTAGARAAYEVAAALRADVYHLHDPELLPYVGRLKKLGAKVVFDSHEDVAGQITSKPWLPVFLRRPISLIYEKYETIALKKADAIVAATPFIRDRLAARGLYAVVVCNYPMLEDISSDETPFSEREAIVCYAGGISDIRGIGVMQGAVANLNCTLQIAGSCEDALPLTRNVEYLGFLDRHGINALYGRSIAGLVLLLPVKNYINSQPIKMYEYMAAGLPVIASDFPLWREVVEGIGCGVCVSPFDTEAVAKAIDSLLGDPERAQRMGERGRRAVEERYNWTREEEALLDLYVLLVDQTENARPTQGAS